MDKNYTIFHLHSDLSNPVTTMSADSTTKFHQYLDYAQQLGMKNIGFSEHGSIMNWVKKKEEVEKRGMKYIHGSEIYLSEYIDKEKGLIRDNYHCLLIAKNFDGVKELNSLISKSGNKEDGHSYYNPRISFDELFNTSDNIMITTACLGSPLWKAIKSDNKEMFNRLMNFFIQNKHRVFLEIQYHNHPEQIQYNQWLNKFSKDYNIPLIAGTDTHSLNEDHAAARKILMKAKGASYGNEDTFDLTFKTFDELVDVFKKQNALSEDVYMEAIHNTNVMANMVEEFKLDDNPKYPKLYSDPERVFQDKIREGIKARGIDKFDKAKKNEYFKQIRSEFNTYKKLDAIDYMLLQKDIIDWCHNNDIYQGYSRGSVAGSIIAYILGVTEVDSIKYNLNFTRFLNSDRVTMADIDADFPPGQRQQVIDHVAEIKGLDFCEIITFNTVAMRGAIREVGRALEYKLSTVDEIAKNIETRENEFRKKYPELFKYVDLINGTIVSVGSHPSGFVVSPINLSENIGLCYTKESKYPVSQINMKELDSQKYVKLDILGLDNVEAINETCKLAGIERKTPDNIDFFDEKVWKSIREDNLGIFQWESETAGSFLKQMFSDDTIDKIKKKTGEVNYLDLLSMGNGAIRPAGESYRNEIANGIFHDNGHKALNNFLESTMNQMVFQEQIMEFLVKFCGFTMGESDLVRRGLAKKVGTEEFLPQIKSGFIKTMKEKYNTDENIANELIKSFLKVIENASGYGFSLNHSNPYSMIGYVNGWLRYYYPLEYLTTLMNIREENQDKTAKIVQYAKKKNIKIKPIQFRKSIDKYNLNKDEQAIYKGLKSIKYMNRQISHELFKLRNEKFDDFVDLLVDIQKYTTCDSRQIKILIKLNFFKEFGKNKRLLTIYEKFEKRHKKTLKNNTKEKRIIEIRKFAETITDESLNAYEQLMAEKDNLGYIQTTYPDQPKSNGIIADIDTTNSPKLYLYQLATGKETMVKVQRKKFYGADQSPNLKIGDIIEIKKTTKRNKQRMIGEDKNGKPQFEPIEGVYEHWLDSCKILERSQ